MCGCKVLWYKSWYSYGQISNILYVTIGCVPDKTQTRSSQKYSWKLSVMSFIRSVALVLAVACIASAFAEASVPIGGRHTAADCNNMSAKKAG